MGIAELELHWQDLGEPGALRVGWWRHTADHPSPFAPGRVFHGVAGAYGILEQRLWRWPGGALGAFVRYGQAQRDRTRVPRCLTAGLHAQGFLPGRPDDELGLALARAAFRPAPGVRSREDAWELTARFLFAGGRIAVQPSWQHIVRVGGRPGAPTLDVGVLRFELDL